MTSTKANSPSLSDAVMVDQQIESKHNDESTEEITPSPSNPDISPLYPSTRPVRGVLLGDATFTADPLASVSPPVTIEVVEEQRAIRVMAKLQGLNMYSECYQ